MTSLTVQNKSKENFTLKNFQTNKSDLQIVWFGFGLQVCQSVLASATLKVYWFEVFGEGRTTHTRYTYTRQAQYHLQTGLEDSPVRKVREKVLTAS